MLTYKIVPDNDAESPRDCDNLSFLHLKHNRRSLGDEGEPDPLGPDDIAIPVYAYEHGGIALSLKPFSDPFDSGQLGVAIVRLEDARKEWSTTAGWKDEVHDGKTLIELVQRCVKAELDVYNTYLNGEACGFEIVTPDGEVVYSCCGYYDREHCEDDAKEALAQAEKDVEPLPPRGEGSLAEFRYLLAIETLRALLTAMHELNMLLGDDDVHDIKPYEAETIAQQLIDEYENATTV